MPIVVPFAAPVAVPKPVVVPIVALVAIPTLVVVLVATPIAMKVFCCEVFGLIFYCLSAPYRRKYLASFIPESLQ
jgi:hypothetical protein